MERARLAVIRYSQVSNDERPSNPVIPRASASRASWQASSASCRWGSSRGPGPEQRLGHEDQAGAGHHRLVEQQRG
ncbi:hypothetical protein, partial [Micromonospora aurantiaca (nom. illeg.)]|uniref:hypothetical protein n=1 Tax=Micromonospora aurantiaca (nom. illeg.) TaxID=47850 RepID=UPI003F4D524B